MFTAFQANSFQGKGFQIVLSSVKKKDVFAGALHWPTYKRRDEPDWFEVQKKKQEAFKAFVADFVNPAPKSESIVLVKSDAMSVKVDDYRLEILLLLA
jgi:hypothetical protein